MTARGYEAYRAVEMQSTDPRRAVILLFEAMERNLARAREALAQAQWEEKHRSLARTQEILQHLLMALDRRPAPELADGLAVLYAHLDRVLAEADLEDDAEKIQYAQGIIAKLTHAWREAATRC